MQQEQPKTAVENKSFDDGSTNDVESFDSIDDTPKKDNGSHHHHHSKYLWLRAAYHCLVTIVGTGILGFPYATANFGWGGSVVIITLSTAGAFYTSILLIFMQEPDHGTYSEVANGVMGRKNFANWYVRPFQYLNFFPTAAVMILVGGNAMSTMDTMTNGTSSLSVRSWSVVMGAIVMTLSLLPDLAHVWQVSLFGSISVFLITFYCIAGSSMAISDNVITPSYDQPLEDTTRYAFTAMAAFGDILFGYGFHTVLPDISASLHETSNEAHSDTKKAVTAAFSYSYPAYLIVALLGYGAFGADVSSNVLEDITHVLSHGAMFVVWAFVVVKTATEATVYNQAAFTLFRDSVGLTDKSDHINHHPQNRCLDYVLRFIWVGAATVVAIFVPYFSDLTSITGAISITPLSFILPVIFWNKKHGETAPRWRIIFHYIFMGVFGLMGLTALIGAIGDIQFRIKEGN